MASINQRAAARFARDFDDLRKEAKLEGRSLVRSDAWSPAPLDAEKQAIADRVNAQMGGWPWAGSAPVRRAAA